MAIPTWQLAGLGGWLISILASGSIANAKALSETITVDLMHGPITEFLPDEVFGGALDGHEAGEVKQIYSTENMQRMLGAGLRKVTYRLRTELGIEAWHWGEEGSWSDPQHSQGYWTSSDQPDRPVLISHGYRLPRRGNTIDQAANDGYSRLTDGDPSSFWKSNPYLDEYFTGEANAEHPQWVVIDLSTPKPVNAIKIDWGVPYATRFEVQYGANIYHVERVAKSDPDWNFTSVGKWRTFPQGSIDGATGEPALLRLSGSPIQVRYLRILLYKSSGKGPPESTDLRDSLGFAIREIFLGASADGRAFRDDIFHAANNKLQTVVYTSSTDPWHRAVDLDLNTEQPGFDLIFQSGITNGLPVLIPVAVLYDTPDNAVAEIRFLRQRGYAIHQLEMGEEPDGQQVSPEHDAALYLEFATAIHNVDPTLTLGGPSFQSGIVRSRFEGEQNELWVTRFLSYLRDHGRLSNYGFLSFEWYPFNDLCQPASQQLLEQPGLLANALERFREQGVPTSIPWIISEYGFSAFAGRSMVEFPSALLNADIVGEFLMLGGRAAYLYGYEPGTPINERSSCAGYGQMMLFQADEQGRAKWPMPTYFAMWLLSHAWAQPSNQSHRLYPARSIIRDRHGRVLVSSFAVQHLDGTWSVLLINKDPKYNHFVRINFAGNKSKGHFVGNIKFEQYSRNQYTWKSAGNNGHPIRSRPPLHFTIPARMPITLPALLLSCRDALPLYPPIVIEVSDR